MKRIVLLLLCAGAAIASQSARADTPQYCDEYANQAVMSATQNMSHGCGFTGLRWVANYQTHYGWCIGAPHDAVVSERLARMQGIVQCHGGPTYNGQW